MVLLVLFFIILFFMWCMIYVFGLVKMFFFLYKLVLNVYIWVYIGNLMLNFLCFKNVKFEFGFGFFIFFNVFVIWNWVFKILNFFLYVKGKDLVFSKIVFCIVLVLMFLSVFLIMFCLYDIKICIFFLCLVCLKKKWYKELNYFCIIFW